MKIPALFLIAMACAILNSCKKADIPYIAGSEQRYQVKLDFNGFTSRIEELKGRVKLKAATAETEWPYIDVINYFVYDLDGRVLKSQYSYYFLSRPDGTRIENPDFGTFSDTLAAGNYRLVFVATHDLIGEVNSNYHFDNSMIHGEDGEPLAHIPDIFYRELLLEVKEDTSIDTLTLERMVGSIDVRLTDEKFPAKCRKITWNYTTFSVFHFSQDNTGRKVELDQDFESFLHNHENRWEETRSFESFVIPDRKTGTLASTMRVTALDAAGEIIAYKVIEGINVEKNKRVILTGELFSGGDPTQGFVVRSDSAYNDTEIIEF